MPSALWWYCTKPWHSCINKSTLPSQDVKKSSPLILRGPTIGSWSTTCGSGQWFKTKSNYRIKTLRVVQTYSFTHQNIFLNFRQTATFLKVKPTSRGWATIRCQDWESLGPGTKPAFKFVWGVFWQVKNIIHISTMYQMHAKHCKYSNEKYKEWGHGMTFAFGNKTQFCHLFFIIS